MDYEKAIELFLKCRDEVDAIDAEAKKAKAEVRKKMAKLEQWITLKSQADGLENINVHAGTGYWSVHNKCSVANPEDFFQFVRANERWDLIEKRASKSAVAAEVEDTGGPPPGVNFSKVSVFNVRRAKKEAE